LEKSEPSISYEAFVEDLDTGDSFTASLVDVLVRVRPRSFPIHSELHLLTLHMQELAERRARPTDRRPIADRTAKTLRWLSTSFRVYRERPVVRSSMSTRRAVNLSEYLSQPQDEMDIEDEDDDFDAVVGDGAASVEGVRTMSDLYEAYAPNVTWSSGLPSSAQRRPHATFVTPPAAPNPEPSAEEAPPSRYNLAYSWTAPPATASTTSSTLQRHPSVRRPGRSRTVDFNDFTFRRRSTIRQNVTQEASAARADEETALTFALPSDDESPTSPAQGESSSTSANLTTRRLFPMPRTRTRRDADPWRITAPHGTLPEQRWMFEEPGSAWLAVPTPASPPSSHEPDSSEEPVPAPLSAPRLRRGGVRAPESMLTRQAPPHVELVRPSLVEINDGYRFPPSPRSPLRFEAVSNPPSEVTAGAEGSLPGETPTSVTGTDVFEPPPVASVS
jgi:hypothetical protein